MSHIALHASTAYLEAEAKKIAQNLGLSYLPHHEHCCDDYCLILTPEFLGLQKNAPHSTPFYLDFSSPTLRFRASRASLRREALARAIGCSPHTQPRLIDATAGLGRDSFILATLGFELQLLERSAVVAALLNDALTRGKKDPLLLPTLSRLELIHTNAITWLSHLTTTERPDVIYLDPMFEPRQKSAAVKKEMAILQQVLGQDEDDELLFNTAISCARQRVVVKRPRLAANIAHKKPNFSLTGNSCRFDVYLSSATPISAR